MYTSLTSRNLEEILDAFEHYFPSSETVYVSDRPFKSLYGEYNWEKRDDFISFIRRLTGVVIKNERDIEHIKKAETEVAKLASKQNEEKVESNTPDKWARESQEAQRQEREESLKKISEQTKKEVEASIERKREIYEQEQERQKIRESFQKKIAQQKEIGSRLEGKKVYAKVEAPVVESPNSNTKEFIEQAKKYPQSFREDLSNNIRAKIESSDLGKTLSPEEVKILADKVANDTIEAVNNPAKQAEIVTQTAILKGVAENKNIAAGVSVDENVKEFLKTAPTEIASFNNTQDISREILSSVDNNLSVSVFGPDPESIKVHFSTQPIPDGTHQINLGELNSHYIQSLQSQSQFFDQMGSLGKQEAKKFLLGRARSFLDSQIAKMPADSALSGLYNSALGQKVLNLVGLSEYVPLEGSFAGSLLQRIPGISRLFGTLGEKTITPVIESGVNALQVATVAGQGAKLSVNVAIGNAVAKGTAWLLGKVGLKAAASKVLAAIGSGIFPVIGTIIGAIAGELLAKIIEKLWPYIKKALPYILGLLALQVAGPLVGAAVCVGALVLMSGKNIGSILAKIGSLIAKLLGMIAMATVSPILIFMLILPPLVVLVILVINSGAYVVPPSSSATGSNPYIDVVKSVTPSGPFANSDMPIKVTYKVTVTAKKSTLTNISFNDICQIINKNGVSNCSTTSLNVPDSISPSTPYTFTYVQTYSGSDYKDSLVTNTITVTANVPESKNQESSGAAAIVIGNPPTACLTFDDSWSASDKVKELTAIARVSKATIYMSTLCKNGAITLHRVTNGNTCSGGGGEITGPNTITIYDAGVRCSEFVTFYTLAHETGHIYAARTDAYQRFDKSGATSEGYICTYPNSLSEPEDFAEMIALYFTKVAGSTKAGCMSGIFKTAYPLHWKFAHDNIFMEEFDW